MRKRLALVLLAPECSSWQSGATDTADAALPAWPGMPSVFAPWTGVHAFAEAWLGLLTAWMTWMLPPRTGD
ncbi:hypothetical protein [Azohydromonas aeria]|uniref:hypothetical protein n=1 Tax=Azohydromonas aeria TaxID=2590212 RepID=UPI0012FB3F83|nr:hypothetical protein [Azohydromonas aeria]